MLSLFKSKKKNEPDISELIRQYNNLLGENNKLWNTLPYLTFIWGNVRTGWVYCEEIRNFNGVQIGDTIELDDLEERPFKGGKVKFKVTSFDGVKDNKIIFTIKKLGEF